MEEFSPQVTEDIDEIVTSLTLPKHGHRMTLRLPFLGECEQTYISRRVGYILLGGRKMPALSLYESEGDVHGC